MSPVIEKTAAPPGRDLPRRLSTLKFARTLSFNALSSRCCFQVQLSGLRVCSSKLSTCQAGAQPPEHLEIHGGGCVARSFVYRLVVLSPPDKGISVEASRAVTQQAEQVARFETEARWLTNNVMKAVIPCLVVASSFI